MTFKPWQQPADAEWDAALRAELDVLRSSILRIGLLGAGIACTPEERARLALMLQEDENGLTLSPVGELHSIVMQLTRDAAKYAQAAVSKAAAAPDDPRRRGSH